MAKPSIGEVVTSVDRTRVKRQNRELVSLEYNSQDSIFSLVFTENGMSQAEIKEINSSEGNVEQDE